MISTEYITWTIAIFALYGTFLNIKKNSKCFVIWTATNGFWAVYDINKEMYAQGALFTVYFILAIYGLYEWKKGA